MKRNAGKPAEKFLKGAFAEKGQRQGRIKVMVSIDLLRGGQNLWAGFLLTLVDDDVIDG